MGWNGSGTFNKTFSWVADKAAGIDITASRFDTQESDFTANGFGNTLTRDGQGQPTANLPMATFRHTGVGNGQARTDYAAIGQVQDAINLNWNVAGGTADAITVTYVPALTALVDGQFCAFRATASNATTTPTFAPNGLTAHTITKAGGSALVAGDIPGNLAETWVRYNLANTRWELLNPSLPAIPAGGISTAMLAANAVTTAKITAANVTYAKIQNVAASSLLGNPTGSPAAPSEITLASTLAFSGTTLTLSQFTPNIQIFTSGSSATYTTPTNGGALPLYLRVRMVGGGGGAGAVNTNAGTNGGDTSFSNWTAVHGALSGTGGGAGGAGGSGGTNGTGTLIRRISGITGQTTANAQLGFGGGTPFSNGPVMASTTNTGASQAGVNAPTNSGAGGGGASNGTTGTAGAGGGEFVEFIITSPASSYTYTVGTGGSGGAAGVQAGGNGAAGRIEVEAFWQ